MSPDPIFARRQLLNDQKVQGSLLKKAAFYGIACLLYFLVNLIFTKALSHREIGFAHAIGDCLTESIYWIPGLLLMVPLVAYDMLKQSNRFAGPVYRMRQEMRLLAENKSEQPLTFRDDDYWAEMADEFNVIREELLELRQQAVENNSGASDSHASKKSLFSAPA